MEFVWIDWNLLLQQKNYNHCKSVLAKSSLSDLRRQWTLSCASHLIYLIVNFCYYVVGQDVLKIAIPFDPSDREKNNPSSTCLNKPSSAKVKFKGINRHWKDQVLKFSVSCLVKKSSFIGISYGNTVFIVFTELSSYFPVVKK